MDTSEVYIKMCEKAEEIQCGHIEFDSGDCYGYEAVSGMIGVFTEGKFRYRDEIWLPRQDQLQAMIKGENHMHKLAYGFSAYFHGTVDPLCEERGRDNYTVDADNSMEQMWLAYVMYKKHNKVWNGEDWIAK
jgi:hypothetical protein